MEECNNLNPNVNRVIEENEKFEHGIQLSSEMDISVVSEPTTRNHSVTLRKPMAEIQKQ